jgi:hypothetical protein
MILTLFFKICKCQFFKRKPLSVIGIFESGIYLLDHKDLDLLDGVGYEEHVALQLLGDVHDLAGGAESLDTLEMYTHV